jgi:hypothetical protein
MPNYPRISVRISADTKIQLQSLALKEGVKPSDLVQACVACLIKNPKCKARKRA